MTGSRAWARRPTRRAGCVVLLFMVACQPQGNEPSAPPRTGSADGSGTLEGFVRFSGDVLPQPTRVKNSTDPSVCGEMQDLEDILVSAADHGIMNVIVALEGVPAEKMPPYEPGRLVVDNRDCRFVPHVSVLTVGSTIVATNSDSVLHTEHYYGALVGNAALPLKDATVTTLAESAGMIIVKCDVHGWMQAFIRVDAHPFHAVTGVNGYFRIADVPPGTYRLEIWHEKLGPQEQTIRIEAGETQTIQVEYSPDGW